MADRLAVSLLLLCTVGSMLTCLRQPSSCTVMMLWGNSTHTASLGGLRLKRCFKTGADISLWRGGDAIEEREEGARELD